MCDGGGGGGLRESGGLLGGGGLRAHSAEHLDRQAGHSLGRWIVDALSARPPVELVAGWTDGCAGRVWVGLYPTGRGRGGIWVGSQGGSGPTRVKRIKFVSGPEEGGMVVGHRRFKAKATGVL